MRTNLPYNWNMGIDTKSLTITQALADEETRLGLTQACYRQIERLNPILNAFITVIPPSTVLANARSAQGELHSIPIAIKDLYETARIRTTAGSLFFKDYIPEGDAVVVKKLKAAGADILGKTSTHEIALGVTNINPHYGSPHNPWNISYITGGSSGGSAAAVAAGMCMAALGTDTGGSIRIPASLCGVVGLKPTYGRVSMRGVFPLSWNLDHAGPLTRSVADAALLLQVIAGYDPDDPSCVDVPVDDYLRDIEAGVKGWKVALAVGEYIEASEPEVLAAVREAADMFGTLGARVDEVDVLWLREAALANGQMTQADGAAFHRERLEQNPELFGADVRQRLETGRDLSSSEYALARRKQVEVRRRGESFFRQHDVLLLPTTPIPAPPIEDIENSARQAPTLTRFTAPFNLSGLPALSIPCGFTTTGLPIGLQIVSGPWQEAKVLQAGRAYETITEWHKQKPTL
ncbi:MAG: Asp-tRNA(Asn)/Glu-tRNA(Gln) amidotransferase subunit GatA [Anaerolineales bacterium]|nr:Asp-tRNA(Asn)/Glu-tRNA(Gln) amidotransferase subunit GatA [Anaerolineales bacterium]